MLKTMVAFSTAFDCTYYTKDEFAQSETSTPSERFGITKGHDWRWRANAGILWTTVIYYFS